MTNQYSINQFSLPCILSDLHQEDQHIICFARGGTENNSYFAAFFSSKLFMLIHISENQQKEIKIFQYSKSKDCFQPIEINSQSINRIKIEDSIGISSICFSPMVTHLLIVLEDGSLLIISVNKFFLDASTRQIKADQKKEPIISEKGKISQNPQKVEKIKSIQSPQSKNTHIQNKILPSKHSTNDSSKGTIITQSSNIGKMSLNPQNIDKLNSVQFSIPIIDPTKAKEISDVQRYFPTEIQTSSDIYSLKTLQIVELGGLNITQTLWWQTQYNLIFALICTLNGQLFIIDMSQQTYIVINYRGRKENEKQGDIGFIGMHITKMRIKDEEESEYNKNIINEKKDGNEQQKGKSLYQDVIQHTPLSNHKTDLLIQTSTFEIFLLPLESEDGELLFHIGSVANKENSFIFIEKKNEKTQKDNIKERMSVNKTDNEKDVRILDQNISVRLHLRRVMIRQLNTGLRLNPVGYFPLVQIPLDQNNKANSILQGNEINDDLIINQLNQNINDEKQESTSEIEISKIKTTEQSNDQQIEYEAQDHSIILCPISRSESMKLGMFTILYLTDLYKY